MADREPEEFEHLPWSNLLAEHRRERGRSLYLVAGIVIALGVGAFGARLVFGGGEATTAPPPTSDSVPPAALPPIVAPMEAVPTSAAEQLPSEADLMAHLPATDELLAVARAEWFVSDYFTVDGSETGEADVVSAFVSGADLPAVPHGIDQPGTSYVEWARAFRLNPLDRGSYAVGVVFRTLYRDEQGEFRRSGVRAVEVEVLVEAGHSGVVDLPMPVPPPFALDLHLPVEFSDPAHEEDVNEALEYAFLFDDQPAVVEATSGAGDWRVVLGIEDASGIEWPMVVRRRLVAADG